MIYSLDEAVAMLSSRHSSKRRAAAKFLRHVREVAAGPVLLQALEREIADPRTWETQYQLIMALAECGYIEALPSLRLLSTKHHNSLMIYTALGDSIVRLGRQHANDVGPVLDLLGSGNLHLLEGAFRAMAMLRMIVSETAIRQIIDFAEKIPLVEAIDHGLWFWLVVASAGWKTSPTEKFLKKCSELKRKDISNAALCALKGEYLACNPL